MITNHKLGKGLQLKSQDELIGKDGNFRSQRIHKTKLNNKVSDKSKDELTHDTRNSLLDPKELGNDKVTNFNKLNEVFSDRINKINDNQRYQRLKEKKDGEIINENKNVLRLIDCESDSSE
ncbi:unnamed protein product [Rhizophagus irregularis]|nr:unnamed protein product [Rhizophagus irregularis]